MARALLLVTAIAVAHGAGGTSNNCTREVQIALHKERTKCATDFFTALSTRHEAGTRNNTKTCTTASDVARTYERSFNFSACCYPTEAALCNNESLTFRINFWESIDEKNIYGFVNFGGPECIKKTSELIKKCTSDVYNRAIRGNKTRNVINKKIILRTRDKGANDLQALIDNCTLEVIKEQCPTLPQEATDFIHSIPKIVQKLITMPEARHIPKKKTPPRLGVILGSLAGVLVLLAAGLYAGRRCRRRARGASATPAA